MSDNDDLMARLLPIFRVEADEHLQVISANLGHLKGGLAASERRAVLEETFREVHTLKGAARSVSQRELEALCQACEALLSRVSRGNLPYDESIPHTLQDAMDLVTRLLSGEDLPDAVSEAIERLERATAEAVAAVEPTSREDAAPAPTGAPIATPEREMSPTPQALDAVRLAVSKLDELALEAEELLTTKLAAAERASESRALMEELARWRVTQSRSQTTITGTGGLLRESDATRLDGELRALERRSAELARRLALDHQATASIVDRLLEDVRRLRMMPVTTVLDLLAFMARDTARGQGKEVEWVARGTELEMDRRVLDAVKDPLIHLVRNAVAHGVESPERRTALGKDRAGRVGVSVEAIEGGMIQIEVTDDGAGIDLAEVRSAAVRYRLLSAEAAQSLTDDDALELIYESGLSTSPFITDLSGHGLGLPIVRERVERLGGRIHIETAPGIGTTVRITIPSSIATFRGLLVTSGGQLFLLPLETVIRAVRVDRASVQSVEGRDVLVVDGVATRVAALSSMLGLAEATEDSADAQLCVILQSGEDRAALVVDDILGDREVLVKELEAPLVRIRHITAAGLLGTGQLALILRPGDLVRSAQSAQRVRAATPVASGDRDVAPTILVVDDSITTRTMEKNLLEAEGYRVRVAVDGLDAWTLLKSEPFDLVLSDVDMPRMNGLDLTARIRADEKLADLPVVLVTALESREDKERGIEVGANAYVVKSGFDRAHLLGTIRRLI